MANYKQIKVNVTPEHHHLLTELSTKENMTIAQFIRSKLDIDLSIKPRVRKKRTDSATYKKVDPALLYQISKIGNNINQIAKAVNERKLNKSDEIISLLMEVRENINDNFSK